MATSRNRKSTAATTETAPAFSLETVIAATKAGSFVYTPAEFHVPLIASGDVEINSEIVDEHGNIATRATSKHTESAQMTQTAAATAAPAKPKFEIKTASELPTRTRTGGGNRAGRAPIYPFDALEVNQYFCVPNEGDKVAAKSLASTVAAANVRYSEEIPGQTRVNRKGATVTATKQLRKFKVFDTEEDGVKGAKVFRVALND